MGEGVAASSPHPRPYNSLPWSLSDSLGLGAGARLSRCLSPTLLSGRLLPEPRGPCARRSPGRPPSPGGSPNRVELAGAGESGARAPRGRGRGPRAAAASPWSRDSGNGVSRPGSGSRGRVGSAAAGWPRVFTCHTGALRPRSPAAAELLCPDPDVWRVLGGREYPVAFPPGGRGRGQRESSRECRVGVGRSCRDQGARVPFALQTPALLVPWALTPVALGLGVRGNCPTAPHHRRGKGRRGCERREFGLHALLLGLETGDCCGGSGSVYRWGKLPRGRRFQVLSSLEVKGQRYR